MTVRNPVLFYGLLLGVALTPIRSKACSRYFEKPETFVFEFVSEGLASNVVDIGPEWKQPWKIQAFGKANEHSASTVPEMSALIEVLDFPSLAKLAGELHRRGSAISTTELELRMVRQEIRSLNETGRLENEFEAKFDLFHVFGRNVVTINVPSSGDATFSVPVIRYLILEFKKTTDGYKILHRFERDERAPQKEPEPEPGPAVRPPPAVKPKGQEAEWLAKYKEGFTRPGRKARSSMRRPVVDGDFSLAEIDFSVIKHYWFSEVITPGLAGKPHGNLTIYDVRVSIRGGSVTELRVRPPSKTHATQGQDYRLNPRGWEGERADVWSIGAMIYEIYTGQLPLKPDDWNQVHRAHLSGRDPAQVMKLAHRTLENATRRELPEGLANVVYYALFELSYTLGELQTALRRVQKRIEDMQGDEN